MRTGTTSDSLSGVAVEDDPFFELILNDPLLLEAAFDDLVDDFWGPTIPRDRAHVIGSAGSRRRPLNTAAGDDSRESHAPPGARPPIRAAKRSPPALC